MRTETFLNGTERNGSYKEIKHADLFRVKSRLNLYKTEK